MSLMDSLAFLLICMSSFFNIVYEIAKKGGVDIKKVANFNLPKTK